MATPRLLEEQWIAHGDGRFSRAREQQAKVDAQVLYELCPPPREDNARHDCSGDRSKRADQPTTYGAQARLDTTVADCLLDRLVHSEYRVEMKGRRRKIR